MTENYEIDQEYAELEPEVEEVADKPDARPVASQPHDWTISTLRDKYDRGQINVQPHYQREYVWDQKPELPSRLIESLLLQIPIPPLYFVRLETGKIEVVDGQQRLTTLIRFVTNQFKLKKLQKLSSLNGKLFQDLSEQEQEKIVDAPIRSIVIDAGTNQDLRYEIFERLNRGSMALNEQEIRNCVYRGLFCDLLAELEQDANWRKIKGHDSPEARFVEREMILRFFSFTNRIDHYSGNLKRFLNDYMGKYAPKDKVQVAELGTTFRQTMQNVNTVFGENAGRLYSVDDGISQEGGRWEKKFSISALDIQASALIGHAPLKVQPVAKSILEAYKFYIATNPQIRTAISRRPAGTEATKTRWFGFKTIVQEILSSPANVGEANDPLFEAKILFKTGYFPAAGAMAGVILEQHLKALCESQNPPLKLRGNTIDPLSETLKSAQIYDQTQHRRIQVMGDIRNRCSHSVANPASKEEVWELIEDVKNFMKGYPVS
ncbi:DUF262 domain-containing protein [Leptolyngbya sp. FACHB-711]|uniref:DUF262 domain-containing protein n=1 Tax=unclassified Leptolyngbya TaxID=2650499 RepID=UPI001682288A|nr:DUF262 domain-containing protein [Leptolyngbya sp. FACHB-711]MBD1849373.1 DUF262 domain-containing protein [Cyanobacteria bacterium FACHB-502]MBD2026233.1 DUF262 domain-containing protein [Leptolyngbya sp. FACHB-711]